ncbi:MAG: YceI family protein [Bacteroidota bacterium]
MKKILVFLLLLSFGMLQAQPLTIDEANALVSFNFVDDDVDGTFEEFDFTGNVDLDDLSNSSISGTVTTKTIDTNNWLRSRHLRAKKYFNASDHPKLKFNSSTISGVKEGFQATGTLVIKGIKRPVVWSFTNNGEKLVGTTSINSQDFDISIHDARNRNKVVITVTLPYAE